MKKRNPSLKYRSFQAINKCFSFTEKLRVKETKDLLFQPVFILGAPRSGTTLLYQSLLYEFDFSFLSNLHCKFFGIPWIVERFFDYRLKYLESKSFNSDYGATHDWFSPSECGEFWYRFFQKDPQFVSNEDVSEKKLLDLKTAFISLQKAKQRPFLIKNLISVLRIEPLQKIFPNALFLIVHRNTADTAHSILEARYKLFQNYDSWFSLKPPNFKTLTALPPEEQAVEQIRSTYKIIDDAKKIRPNHFFDVNYDDFCTSPNDTLNLVAQFLKSHNVSVNRNRIRFQNFDQRNNIRIDLKLYDKLEKYLLQNPL